MINYKVLFKSFVYRLYSSVITFLITFIVTGSLTISTVVGMADSIVKIGTYYIFDIIWNFYSNKTYNKESNKS